MLFVIPLIARLFMPILSLMPTYVQSCDQILLHFSMMQQRQGSAGLQAATDEYIEQNDDRFGELAALLLKGRADLAAERTDTPAALSLGEQGLHCIMAWHALELAGLYALQVLRPLLLTGMC